MRQLGAFAILNHDAVILSFDSIDVTDRVVLSENLTQANVRAYLQGQGFIGSGGGRFFLNGVDTETTGVDIVTNYAFPETAYGTFNVTAGANPTVGAPLTLVYLAVVLLVVNLMF